MPFDVAGARAAGYSDADIAGKLADTAHFDLNGARAAGYSDAEISDHLSAHAHAPITGIEQAPHEASLVESIFGREDPTGNANVAGVLPSLGETFKLPDFPRLGANIKTQLGADIAGQVAGAGAMLSEGAARAAENPRHPGQGFAGHQFRDVAPADRAAQFRTSAAEQLAIAREAAQGSAEAQPADAGVIERTLQGGAVSAGESLGSLAVASLTGGAGLLVGPALMGAGQGAQRYAQLRNAGLDEATSAKSAALWTGLETVTEGLPFEALLSDIPGFKARLLKFLAAELPGENATTVGEMVDDFGLGLRGDETVGELMAAIPQALSDTTLQTLVAGGPQAVVAHGLERVGAGLQEQPEAGGAPPLEQQLQALGDVVVPPQAPALPAPPAPRGPPQLPAPALEVTPTGTAGTRAQLDADAARTLQVTPEGEAGTAGQHEQRAAEVVQRATELGLGDDIVANLQRLEERKVAALANREARRQPVEPPAPAPVQPELAPPPLGDVPQALAPQPAEPAIPPLGEVPLPETAAPIALGDAIAPPPATPVRPQTPVARPEPPASSAPVITPVATGEKPALKQTGKADERVDDVLAYVAKRGGIDTAEAIAQGIDPATVRSSRGYGIRKPFKKGGMSFDAAAEMLDEAGFPVTDEQGRYSANKVLDILDRATRGEKIYSTRNTTASEQAAAEQRAAGEREIESKAITDRRSNIGERKRVAAMSHEELQREVLTSHLTGLPNRRAYDEETRLPHQASIDVDSLKWVNDNMGHASGDELLKAVGQALGDISNRAYHFSGDEFVLEGADEAELRTLMDDVEERLGRATIEVTKPDGSVVTFSNIGVSYGTGATLNEADQHLATAKTEREAQGVRAARGARPPGATSTAPEGLADHEGNAAPAEESQGTVREPTPPELTRERAPADEGDDVEHVTLKGEGFLSHTSRMKAITLPSNLEGEEAPIGDRVGEEQINLFGPTDARPLSTAKQIELANKLMDELDRYAAKDGDVKTLAVAFNQEYRRDHSAALVGKVIKDAKDLATFAQVFRDPRYETLRYFALDENNKIVGESAVSSRLPGSSAAWPKGADIEWVKQFVKRTGAKKLRMLHNHPSGTSTPSDADKNLTLRVAGFLKMPVTHVVIDSNEYSVMRVPLSGDRLELEVKTPLVPHRVADKILTPSKPHAVLGREIKGNITLAEVGKEIQKPDYVAVIGVAGNPLRVRSAGEVHADVFLDRARARTAVLRFGLQNGNLSTLANLPNEWLSDMHMRSTMIWMIEKGHIIDAVTKDGTAFRQFSMRSLTELDLGLPVHELAAERGPYAQTPKPEEPSRGDLLGDDTHTKQELADKERAKDKKRSPNKDVAPDTGAPGDLFTARRQMDIDEVRDANKLPEDTKLEVDESADGEGFVIRAEGKDDGREHGEMILSGNKKTKTLQIRESFVWKAQRGKGIGQNLIRRAYEVAAERGWRLVSDRIVSIDQLRVYNALQNQGWTIEYADPAEVERQLDAKDMPGIVSDGPVVTRIAPPAKGVDVVREGDRDQTDTPAFKKWFGDSKVVDENGAPLVVYHGTNQALEAFDPERRGRNTASSSSLHAFFFTDGREVAGQYADLSAKRQIPSAPAHEKKTARLMREVAKAEREAVRTGKWDEHERLQQELETHEYGAINAEPAGANVVPVYLSLQNPKEVHVGGQISTADVTRWIGQAKKAGNDGLIMRDVDDTPSFAGGPHADHFAVFEPTQIKSAIGNTGEFNPSDENIVRDPSKYSDDITHYAIVDEDGAIQPWGPFDSERAARSFLRTEAGNDKRLSPKLVTEREFYEAAIKGYGEPPTVHEEAGSYGDRRETARRNTTRQAPGRRSTDVPPAAGKGYAAAAQRAIDAWNTKIGWRYSPLGKLPGKRAYLEERYKALGRVGQSQDIGREIYAALSKANDADKQAVYDYLTTRAGDSSSIEDKDVRRSAIRAKNLIDTIGKRLVESGLLSQQAYEAHAGEYLPRVYLKHLLGDNAFMALGNGKKLSDLGYLKQRQEIPEEVRKVILGEITDPAFLASFGATRTLRDLALVDFLTKIAGREQWTPKGAVIDWNGRPVSPFWLSEEARQLRRRAKFYKPEEATKARAVADAMDSAVDDALEHLGKPDTRQFEQIPNSNRYGALRGLWVRKEIYDDLVGAQGFVPRDASVAEMLFGQGGFLTKFTRWWKMSKVVLNPPTQIRNFLSNLVLLHLSGVPMRRVYSGEIVGKAIHSIANKDRYYQIAQKYGLFAATFANQEGARIRDEWIAAQDLEGSGLAKMRAFAARASNVATDIYAYSEAVGKIAKLIDGMDREGKSPADAMLDAHEALFDYSLVPRSVQYLRNQPLGAPFITFMYKALGKLSETAVLHPARFAAYAAIPYLLAELIKNAYDVDDDDLKRLRKAFPAWMRERGHMLLLPWKDSEGRWQVADMGYLAPWGQFADLAAAVSEGKGVKELAGLAILSGPLADVTAALETNIDPFTGKEIVRSTDPPAMKYQQLMQYIWNLTVPGILSESGGINQLRKAVRGDTNLRGEPGQTATQAAMRLFGINVYPVDPENTRDANIRGMRFALNEKRQRLRELLKNPNLTKKEIGEISRVWTKILEADADAIGQYEDDSKINPKLAVPPVTFKDGQPVK